MTGLLSGAFTELAERSAESWRDLFDELPVSLDVFVQDSRYLASKPLFPEQYAAVQYAERIYRPDTYQLLAGLDNPDDPSAREYWSVPRRNVNFVTLQWGKGSGKDHVAGVISMRIAYLLLCLRSPQSYYGHPDTATIHLLNVAASSAQANRAFFAPVRRAVRRGWFAGKARPLKDHIEYVKNIEAISGHSDAESQEGLNLICGVCDETDAFKSREELAQHVGGVRARESSSSAEAIISMIHTSASTRFPREFKNVYISFPRYLGSTIQKLTDEARADNEQLGEASRRYVSGPLATWEVNPLRRKDDFADDYAKDPVEAAAKYECKPSRAIDPYFTNIKALRACFADRDRAPLAVSYLLDGAAWRPVWDISPDLYPVRGAAYAVHADLAVKGDRAGIAMAHVVRWDEATVLGHDHRGREIEVREQRPVVKADFVVALEADPAAVPPREIQVRWYRMLVLELVRRGFNIRLATADRFQSTDNLQILESRGIETDLVSTDRDPQLWQNVRDLASEGRLLAVHHPLLWDELLGLSRMPNGKVDHPVGGSKDMADALAGSVAGALVLGGAEDPSGARAYPASWDWPVPELADLPAGMPGGEQHLAFEAELPDFISVTGPEQVAGEGWLFAETGEAYGGMV